MRFSNHNAALVDSECRKSLRQLRNHIRAMKQTDPMIRHLTNYAVIICSGALERAFKSIVADYVSVGGSIAVCKYIDKTIRHNSTNPSSWKIQKTLESFDMGWNKSFESLYKGYPEKSRQALGSIIENRNNIAHGMGVSVGFNAVVGYYCRARNIIAGLEVVLR